MIRPKKCTPFTTLLVTLLMLVLLLPGGGTLAANSTVPSPFSDVSAGDQQLLYIKYLNTRGILHGFPDGSFHPSAGLTRAQAAVIISKAAHLDTSTQSDSSFNDVSPEHWAAQYIAAAVKAGYLHGMGDGSYQPEQSLTRAQAISLIMRLSRQEDSGTALPPLQDMPPSHWAARSMTMAIDAGMISLEGNTINPDQNITRQDVSRALAVMLTSDPDLFSCPLYGTLKVKSGQIKIIRAGQETVTVKDTTPVSAGDTIKTLDGATAEINYPDGSSLLLKEKSILTIKKSQGRAYIQKDGRPGTAVDNLHLQLHSGNMFGALSSLTTPKNAPTAVSAPETHKAVTAEKIPWYKSYKQEKVKVTIDMDWGVATIRGTCWNIMADVFDSGFMSLLTGSGSLTSGAQTQILTPGQSIQGIAGGGPPAPPTPMTPPQIAQWSQQESWVLNTLDNMAQNQSSPPPENIMNPFIAPNLPDPASHPLPALEETLRQIHEILLPPPNIGREDRSSSNGSGDSNNLPPQPFVLEKIIVNSQDTVGASVYDASLTFRFNYEPDMSSLGFPALASLTPGNSAKIPIYCQSAGSTFTLFVHGWGDFTRHGYSFGHGSIPAVASLSGKDLIFELDMSSIPDRIGDFTTGIFRFTLDAPLKSADGRLLDVSSDIIPTTACIATTALSMDTGNLLLRGVVLNNGIVSQGYVRLWYLDGASSEVYYLSPATTDKWSWTNPSPNPDNCWLEVEPLSTGSKTGIEWSLDLAAKGLNDPLEWPMGSAYPIHCDIKIQDTKGDWILSHITGFQLAP